MFWVRYPLQWRHMSIITSNITGRWTVCPSVSLGQHQGKHESPCYRPRMRENHWWPLDSPHKGPVTRKAFPWHEIITVGKHIWCFSYIIALLRYEERWLPLNNRGQSKYTLSASCTQPIKQNVVSIQQLNKQKSSARACYLKVIVVLASFFDMI